MDGTVSIATLGPLVAVALAILLGLGWRYWLVPRCIRYDTKLGNAANVAVSTLRERYPGTVVAALSGLDVKSQPTTARIWFVLKGDIAARVREFSFDASIPSWAWRRLGRERDAVCNHYLGGTKPENFTAFLLEHCIPHADDEILPADFRQLADMQGTVWASLYAAGWPVLCVRTGFIDVDYACESDEKLRKRLDLLRGRA